MKRMLILLLCAGTVLSLSACSSKDTSVTQPDVSFDFDDFYEKNKGDGTIDDSIDIDSVYITSSLDDIDNQSSYTDDSSSEVHVSEDDYAACSPADTEGYWKFDTEYFSYEMPESWKNCSVNDKLLFQGIITPESDGIIIFFLSKLEDDEAKADETYDFYREYWEGKGETDFVRRRTEDLGGVDADVIEYKLDFGYSRCSYFFTVNGVDFYMNFTDYEETDELSFNTVKEEMEHIVASFKTK